MAVEYTIQLNGKVTLEICPLCQETMMVEHGSGPGGGRRHIEKCPECGISYPWVLYDCPFCPEPKLTGQP